MKIKLLVLVFMLLASQQLIAATDSTKVLFIGNSLTYFNDMPILFQSIAHNKGKKVSVSSYTVGGAGIVNHYTDPSVFAIIRSKKWDVVVLQPGTGESAGASFLVDTTVKRARILLDSVYRYSPCCKVYLYQIPYGVTAASEYGTYFSVQTRILDSVTKMADALRVQMVPAGECARVYYTKSPNLFLHGAYNDVHPNANGSLLIASAFYVGIFQETISGCSFYATTPKDSAVQFFSIADTLILNNKTKWRINNYNLYADFKFTTTGSTVSFTSAAVNATSVLWDFGDLSTSTLSNPSHSYLSPGTYTVKFFAYNGSCVDSIMKQIKISTTSISEIPDKDIHFKLYPNPAHTALFLEGINQQSSDIGYTIFDYTAGKISDGNLSVGKTEIDLRTLPSGIYFILLYQKGLFLEKHTFIKQ